MYVRFASGHRGSWEEKTLSGGMAKGHEDDGEAAACGTPDVSSVSLWGFFGGIFKESSGWTKKGSVLIEFMFTMKWNWVWICFLSDHFHTKQRWLDVKRKTGLRFASVAPHSQKNNLKPQPLIQRSRDALRSVIWLKAWCKMAWAASISSSFTPHRSSDGVEKM